MIAILAFYLFATLTIVPAIAVIFARNPVQRAVADPRLLQRGGADAAGRGRVHRHAAGHRLRRRGRGAVPVRGDDARHRLRDLAQRVHPQPAVRDHHRARPFGRDRDRGQRMGGGAGIERPARPGDRPAQHRRLGAAALQPLSVPIRDRGADPAGGDDRRDRPHPSPAQGHAAAADFTPGPAPAAGRDQAHPARNRRGDEAGSRAVQGTRS